MNERTAEKLAGVLDWYYGMSFGVMYYKASANTKMAEITPVSLFNQDFAVFMPFPGYQKDFVEEKEEGFFTYATDLSADVTALKNDG